MARPTIGAAELVAVRVVSEGRAVRVVSLPRGAGRLFVGRFDGVGGFGPSVDFPTLEGALEALLTWPEARASLPIRREGPQAG